MFRKIKCELSLEKHDNIILSLYFAYVTDHLSSLVQAKKYIITYLIKY